MFQKLKARGFQVEFTSHAQAILAADFPQVEGELDAALLGPNIPIVELIESGGGEAQATQRLRKALSGVGWAKRKVEIKKMVDGVERESVTHEIDHVRQLPAGSVALEIEWNNKDPFFDRDLENFKRLHAEGVFSVGVIVTRGTSFQADIRGLVHAFAASRGIAGFEGFQGLNYRPTPRFQDDVKRRVARGDRTFIDVWSDMFCSDKYGEATTHWDKLKVRIARGVGNPCPLLLIGLPSSTITT
jgi:hypothetical protein